MGYFITYCNDFILKINNKLINNQIKKYKKFNINEKKSIC